ncbi:unnamed protein product [Protopolystoma xenopodis]|uniref:AMMECR1 domain-containing protein n=1 Tax=Protopolystoma xenopodis TaxID=117903 RepID=A0A3S5CBP1_9PLAT|nr:unnamed protein product [Protopolystoma xenopodis]
MHSWNHRETIDSLLRKGGYRASINESVRQSIRLTRYRSEKLTLHAQEYLRERQGGVLYAIFLRDLYSEYPT